MRKRGFCTKSPNQNTMNTDNETTPPNTNGTPPDAAIARAAGKKSTNAELETRIDFTVELLTQGRRMSQIKKSLRDKFGPISARTCSTYVSRGRERMLKESGLSREELRAESFSFYQSIISDPK